PTLFRSLARLTDHVPRGDGTLVEHELHAGDAARLGDRLHGPGKRCVRDVRPGGGLAAYLPTDFRDEPEHRDRILSSAHAHVGLRARRQSLPDEPPALLKTALEHARPCVKRADGGEVYVPLVAHAFNSSCPGSRYVRKR